MTFNWESEKERLLKFIKIPAKKKLEWLYQMNEFVTKCSSKKDLSNRRKFREMQ